MRKDLSYMIRKASSTDASSIAEIHQTSRQNAYKHILPEELLNKHSTEEREEHWKKQISQADSQTKNIYVVEYQQQMVGFAVLVLNSEDAEIDRLYVLPDFTGRGIGRALVRHCMDRLSQSQCVSVTLWTFEGNAAARRFYEYVGFVLDGNVRELSPFPKEIRYSMSLKGS